MAGKLNWHFITKNQIQFSRHWTKDFSVGFLEKFAFTEFSPLFVFTLNKSIGTTEIIHINTPITLKFSEKDEINFQVNF